MPTIPLPTLRGLAGVLDPNAPGWVQALALALAAVLTDFALIAVPLLIWRQARIVRRQREQDRRLAYLEGKVDGLHRHEYQEHPYAYPTQPPAAYRPRTQPPAGRRSLPPLNGEFPQESDSEVSEVYARPQARPFTDWQGGRR